MKALFIDPAEQKIEEVEVANVEDIAKLVGFDTLESENIGPDNDHLFFDEECFIRGNAAAGRFQIGTGIPVSGKGVVVGETGAKLLVDVVSTADSLSGRIKFQ